eukprot:6492665-Amphidinium_carterae.3
MPTSADGWVVARTSLPRTTQGLCTANGGVSEALAVRCWNGHQEIKLVDARHPAKFKPPPSPRPAQQTAGKGHNRQRYSPMSGLVGHLDLLGLRLDVEISTTWITVNDKITSETKAIGESESSVNQKTHEPSENCNANFISENLLLQQLNLSHTKRTGLLSQPLPHVAILYRALDPQATPQSRRYI